MNHNIIKIYKAKEKIETKGLKELEIGGKIRFLKDILLKNNQFRIDEQGNWILKFFAGKNYEQNLFITDESKSVDYKKYDFLSTLSIIIDDNDFNNKHAEKLSLSIRGSKAVKPIDFIEYPSHYEHIDGRGFSFYSRIPEQENNFNRKIILLALAYAYLGAIELISNKLAECVNCAGCDMEELNKLYIEAAKFNSVFFFHQPVLIKNASLTETWKCIDKVLEVNLSSNELLEQLSTVHYILNLDTENRKREQEKQKQSKQEKWNYVFAVIGILIGLIELFTG